MGSLINVFLCDYNVIKKALSRNEISHRPNFFTYSVFTEKGQMLGKVSVMIFYWEYYKPYCSFYDELSMVMTFGFIYSVRKSRERMIAWVLIGILKLRLL